MILPYLKGALALLPIDILKFSIAIESFALFIFMNFLKQFSFNQVYMPKCM
jgi:hypothetical protein